MCGKVIQGGTAPAPQVWDLWLQALGRTPNGKKLSAEKAVVAVTDRGFISVDIQMRTNVSHIFAIGDIVGQLILAHKAVHECKRHPLYNANLKIHLLAMGRYRIGIGLQIVRVFFCKLSPYCCGSLNTQEPFGRSR